MLPFRAARRRGASFESLTLAFVFGIRAAKPGNAGHVGCFCAGIKDIGKSFARGEFVDKKDYT